MNRRGSNAIPGKQGFQETTTGKVAPTGQSDLQKMQSQITELLNRTDPRNGASLDAAVAQWEALQIGLGGKKPSWVYDPCNDLSSGLVGDDHMFHLDYEPGDNGMLNYHANFQLRAEATQREDLGAGRERTVYTFPVYGPDESGRQIAARVSRGLPDEPFHTRGYVDADGTFTEDRAWFRDEVDRRLGERGLCPIADEGPSEIDDYLVHDRFNHDPGAGYGDLTSLEIEVRYEPVEREPEE